jgi:choline kinase
MTTIKFVTAESAAESEPLFRSLTHDELVQNCIAAQQMIGTQIARAEYHKERADRVSELGKETEMLCRKYLGVFERVERHLSAATKEFAGRDKRKARAEIYANVLASIREILAAAAVALPKINWSSFMDIHPTSETK